MKKKLSKGISITKYFWCFIIILFVVVTSVYVFLIWQNNLNNSTSILKTQSSRIEKSFVDSVDHTAYLMNYINSQIKEHQSSDLNYIKNLLSSFRLKQDDVPWNMFSWFDKKCRLIVNNEKGIVDPLDSCDKAYLQDAFQSPNKIYLGELAYGRLSGELIIPAGMSVADKDGEVIGGLIVGIQIKKLIHGLSNSLNAAGVEFAFFDRNFQVIFNSSNFVYDKNITKNLAVKSLNNDSGLLTKFSFFSKNSTLSYYQKIDQYPYFIVVEYDQKLFKQNLMARILPYFFQLLLVLLTLCFFMFIFKRFVINPISQLSLASRIIASNYTDRLVLPESRIPEINQLSIAILSIKRFIKNEHLLINEFRNLTTSIHDDLRQYISRISGLAKAIDDEVKSNNSAKLGEYVRMIVKESELMLKFSESLLDQKSIEENNNAKVKMSVKNLEDKTRNANILAAKILDKHNHDQKVKIGKKKIKTILVVDDNEVNLLSIKYQLNRVGYDVFTSQTSAKALEILDKNSCDLIIMNTNIRSIGDGFYAAKTIRDGEIFKHFRHYKSIPIIALGNDDQASRNSAIRSDMNGYLVKPFKVEEFTRIITEK